MDHNNYNKDDDFYRRLRSEKIKTGHFGSNTDNNFNDNNNELHIYPQITMAKYYAIN